MKAKKVFAITILLLVGMLVVSFVSSIDHTYAIQDGYHNRVSLDLALLTEDELVAVEATLTYLYKRTGNEYVARTLESSELWWVIEAVRYNSIGGYYGYYMYVTIDTNEVENSRYFSYRHYYDHVAHSNTIRVAGMELSVVGLTPGLESETAKRACYESQLVSAELAVNFIENVEGFYLSDLNEIEIWVSRSHNQERLNKYYEPVETGRVVWSISLNHIKTEYDKSFPYFVIEVDTMTGEIAGVFDQRALFTQ